MAEVEPFAHHLVLHLTNKLTIPADGRYEIARLAQRPAPQCRVAEREHAGPGAARLAVVRLLLVPVIVFV